MFEAHQNMSVEELTRIKLLNEIELQKIQMNYNDLEYYTIKDICWRLKKSDKTIRRYIKRLQISPDVSLVGKYKVSHKDFMRIKRFV